MKTAANGDETILAALGNGAATAAEIAAVCRMPAAGVAGRLANMMRKGLVRPIARAQHGQRTVQVWARVAR